MNRAERTERKMQELFHSHAAGEEGPDPEFMQMNLILLRKLF